MQMIPLNPDPSVFVCLFCLFFLSSLGKTIIFSRGPCETNTSSFTENWNETASWRRTSPHSSDIPRLRGPAALLHRVIVASWALCSTVTLSSFLEVFVYKKSLLFMQLLSSLSVRSCIYPCFTLRSLIPCVLPEIKNMGCFITKNIHFIRLLNFSSYFQNRRKEEGSKYTKPKTIIKFTSEAPCGQGKRGRSMFVP